MAMKVFNNQHHMNDILNGCSSDEQRIVLFESKDGEVSLPVAIDPIEQEVWLNREQLGILFDRDVKTIGKHVNNALREELADQRGRVVAKIATTAADGKRYQVEHYALDVIISVGYRVKSQRGVEFRRWATDVLKRYILKGHAENEGRLRQLGEVVRIIERIPGELASREILDIVESYTEAYELLDAYDREAVPRPKGERSTYVLDYDECMALISQMRPRFASDIFGREKDDSFRSSIAAIYQSFGGEELYPSIEEKAANLLYFVIKNHSFVDGNKRIACSLFLYFLDRNGALFRGIEKRVSDSMLVAMALMIAESRPEEKESMVSLVMNFLM